MCSERNAPHASYLEFHGAGGVVVNNWLSAYCHTKNLLHSVSLGIARTNWQNCGHCRTQMETTVLQIHLLSVPAAQMNQRTPHSDFATQVSFSIPVKINVHLWPSGEWFTPHKARPQQQTPLSHSQYERFRLTSQPRASNSHKMLFLSAPRFSQIRCPKSVNVSFLWEWKRVSSSASIEFML